MACIVVVPKVNPNFVVAISNNYGTMRYLLKEYMDPSKL
jgi:hypothetical protein